MATSQARKHPENAPFFTLSVVESAFNNMGDIPGVNFRRTPQTGGPRTSQSSAVDINAVAAATTVECYYRMVARDTTSYDLWVVVQLSCQWSRLAGLP